MIDECLKTQVRIKKKNDWYCFYLNSGFRDHSPSPRCLWKLHISWSNDLKRTVSELGSLCEKCFKSSTVVACPSVLHCVAIKSLNSDNNWLCSLLCISCTVPERSSVLEKVWAFLDLILASRKLEVVLVEPRLESPEVVDVPDIAPSKWATELEVSIERGCW